MRRVIAMLLTTLALAPASPDGSQSRPPDVGAGRIAWFDLTTTDMQRSKQFYSQLFDWTFTAVSGTGQAAEIVSSGTPIGTLRTAEGQISSFNGVVYVQVTNVREACRKATALGGTVIPGFPFNLPNGNGAVGLVLDPAGHPVGLYSRTPLSPQAGASMLLR